MDYNKHYKKELPIISLFGMGGGVGSNLIGGVTKSDNWILVIGGSDNDRANDVAVNSSGDVYVVGQTASTGAGSNSGWIGKFDSQATEQWQRTLGSTNSDRFEQVSLDSSDNVYVDGYSQGVGQGQYDGVIVKYNSSGTLQWQRTLGGSSQDFLIGSIADSSGNVYVAGQTSSTGQGSYDALFAKYNSSGTLQWQRTCGDSNSGVARGAGLDSSDNLYTAGYQGTNTNVFKYNSSGTFQWAKQLEVGDAQDIAVDSSGNSFIVGQHSGGGPHLRIHKRNNGGDFQWQKTLGGTGTTYGYGICLDSSGNIYVVGETNVEGAGIQDVLILKYNSSGTLQWQRTLGGTGADYGIGIAHDGSGNVIIAGRTYSAGAGNADILIAKLPDDGSLTGTYGSFTYAASSLTADSPSNPTGNPSYTSATSSLTSATSNMTSSSASLSKSTEYIP